ncbi:hypothetical protein GPECTOR_1g584 [Gonium pectorale]|uniref:CCD97-like C-terminal domain-containing protein n=1 Tax=Gonium pectorale TaxID=33097 RepID=A0A150H491_GONPE|nr:hypothetical protein GPECTOR_1g584 [Gonium pectorale]|eukprot:KXZ56648.1 hypothetical protein GPECTOR_1g584 [Gonium pectorale]
MLELNHFEALRSADWEVAHWLTHYAAQRVEAAEQAADPKRLPARVKNRRLAAMRRMVAEGEYFSDESMRQRAPLLYHQQLKVLEGTARSPWALSIPFGPPGVGESAAGHGGGGQGPAGHLFSQFLLRQHDEAQLVMRRMREQQEEDAQFSEHESDEEEEEEEEDGDTAMSDGERPRSRRARGGAPSAADVAQMRRDFVSEMEARFLLGQDGQYVDYATIDADASLDADWLEEESRDAEEKYFDED